MEKNYFSGIVGGILGGLLFSIPWVVAYTGFNIILSALAIIIGIGVLKGYQLLNGKVTKALPWIVMLISILIVTIETLFLIPLILAYKEGMPFSIATLQYFYSFDDAKMAILKDLVLALLFTLLGISPVIASVKKQLEGPVSEDTVIGYGKERSNAHQQVKDYFIERGALSLEQAITVDYSSGLNQDAFLSLQDQGIIHYVDGKYYMTLQGSQETVLDVKKKKKLRITLLIIGISLVVGSIFFAIISGNNDDENVIRFDSNHSIVVDDHFFFVQDEQEDSVYYIYDKNGESGIDGSITVSFEKEFTYDYSEDDLQLYVDSFNQYSDVEVTSSRSTFTGHNDHLLELVLHVSGVEEEESYDYYDVVHIVYTDFGTYFIETIAGNMADCNALIDGSGILDTIQ